MFNSHNYLTKRKNKEDAELLKCSLWLLVLIETPARSLHHSRGTHIIPYVVSISPAWVPHVLSGLTNAL